MCIPFGTIILILLNYIVRILLKLHWNQVLLLWLQNSMEFLVLDLKKSRLGVLNLSGEQDRVSKFPSYSYL